VVRNGGGLGASPKHTRFGQSWRTRKGLFQPIQPAVEAPLCPVGGALARLVWRRTVWNEDPDRN
jgi:hypothetical protein